MRSAKFRVDRNYLITHEINASTAAHKLDWASIHIGIVGGAKLERYSAISFYPELNPRQ